MKPKRAISLLLAGCIAVSMVPASAVTAFAETVGNFSGVAMYANATSGTCGKAENDDVHWSYDSNTKTLTISGTGEMKDYDDNDIPLWYDSFHNDIENVVMNKGITSIGNNAFYDCTSLTSVTIPKGITSIGDSAFDNCSLQSIEIPYGVLSIGSHAFGVCPFTSVTIPDSVTSIGEYAFEESYLTGVIIPASVKTIGERAFADCIYLTDVQISSGVTSISEGMFDGCTQLERVTIPSSVTSIGQDAFDCDNLKTVCYTGDENGWSNISSAFSSSITPHYVHSVTFKDGNDIIKEEIVESNQPVSTPQDPTKEGYTFVGWSTDGTDNDWKEKELFAPNNLITENTTLYAVWKRVSATLDMTVAQGEHKVKESVKVKVSVTPNDYGREISNSQIVMTYDDDVASVELKGRELKDKSYDVSTLASAGAFELEGTAMTATLDVTYAKPGKHEFTVEIKNGENVLCSDTATIEIAKEEEKPTNPEKPADSEKPEPKPEGPETPVVKLYNLTVKNAEVTIADADGKAVETTKNEDGTLTAKVPEKAAVTVKYTAPTDAIVFDLWSITSDAKLDVNVKENPLTFTMPDKAVTVEAMTRDATIESDGPGVLGTAAMIGVGVAGTAVLGYQGYMIGTELYLKNVMPAGAAIPTNTAELAKLVWNDAGCPEPVALLAADATDEQKALTWAVENKLISADKAADASVTRWEVIQAWNQEQEMKKA